MSQTYGFQAAAPVVLVPNVSGRPMPVFIAPQQPQIAPQQQPQPAPVAPVLNEQDLKQIQEMFPNIDPEVVKSVYEANRGHKDITINSLLQMTNDWTNIVIKRIHFCYILFSSLI